MKRLLQSSIAFALVTQASLLFADGSSPVAITPPVQGEALILAVQKNLKLMYPKTRFDQVKATPLPGIYEVVMGRNVAFVEESGRYFIFGRLFDMESQEDITSVTEPSAPAKQNQKVDFGTLPLGSSIKTVKGDGSRVLAVFSDPDCQYCRKLEQELNKIDNVTIYTFLMPLEQLHPQARSKSDAVWCAKDRSAAWKTLMVSGKAPSSVKGCEAPHAIVSEIAEKLGISGTPFLVAGDGRTMPGAVPADRLNAWLSQTDKAALAKGAK